MKKSFVMLILMVACLAAGCGNKKEQGSQISVETENVKDDEDSVIETPTQEEKDAEENDTESYDLGKVDEYMASLKEQSDSIKDFLAYDAVTQEEMNAKSKELYVLWDDALNYLWGELKTVLPEDEFGELLDAQRTWSAEKESAVEAVGKEVEGGSIYPLVVNSEAARITEERVYELYEILK